MMANDAMPLFIFLYWTSFGAAWRLWRRWQGRPVSRMSLVPMMVFAALWLVTSIIGVMVRDAFPACGAWAVIGVHVLIGVAALGYSILGRCA
jgi:hypothetical protein